LSDDLANRESSHGGNTAHVAVVTGHEDVSVLSPSGSPRVLDDPIGLVVEGSPSDSQHSVVQLRSRAVGIRVDTRGVELERGLRSVDGDGGGSNEDGVLESSLVSLVDVLEALQSGTRVGSIV